MKLIKGEEANKIILKALAEKRTTINYIERCEVDKSWYDELKK